MPFLYYTLTTMIENIFHNDNFPLYFIPLTLLSMSDESILSLGNPFFKFAIQPWIIGRMLFDCLFRTEYIYSGAPFQNQLLMIFVLSRTRIQNTTPILFYHLSPENSPSTVSHIPNFYLLKLLQFILCIISGFRLYGVVSR